MSPTVLPPATGTVSREDQEVLIDSPAVAISHVFVSIISDIGDILIDADNPYNVGQSSPGNRGDHFGGGGGVTDNNQPGLERERAARVVIENGGSILIVPEENMLMGNITETLVISVVPLGEFVHGYTVLSLASIPA